MRPSQLLVILFAIICCGMTGCGESVSDHERLRAENEALRNQRDRQKADAQVGSTPNPVLRPSTANRNREVPWLTVAVFSMATALLIVIECRLAAERPSQRLSSSQISFRNRVAVVSMCGVVGSAVISVFLGFTLSLRVNASIADWVLSLLLCGAIPLSYMNFLLAIARYRRHYVAQLFTLACCGVTFLLGLALFWEIRSDNEPSLGSLPIFLMLSAAMGFLCLMCLRIGEFIGSFITGGNSSLPLLELPKSRVLRHALGWMPGAAAIGIGVSIEKPADLSQTVGQFFMKLVLPYFCGAFATDSMMIRLLGIAAAVVFSMTILIPRFRSRTMAKLTFSVFMLLSLITLWFDGFIVAMFNPMFSRAWAEAVAHTGFTEVVKRFVAFPLDLCVTIAWLILWGVMFRALDAELSDPVIRREAVRPAGYEERWLSNERIVPILWTGGAAFLINSIVLAMWAGTLMLFAKWSGAVVMPGGMESMLALSFFPVVGVVAVTGFEMRHFSRERLFSWEPWDRSSNHVFSHVAVALLSWTLIECVFFLFLAVRHA